VLVFALVLDFVASTRPQTIKNNPINIESIHGKNSISKPNTIARNARKFRDTLNRVSISRATSIFRHLRSRTGSRYHKEITLACTR
jgi:hypothetical protein